ncbi:MAG: hypothetical protein AB7U43_05250 [Desulfobacter sp.]
MNITLPKVIALEVAEKDAKVQDSAGNWIAKGDGSKVHSLVFYQHNSDFQARQAEIPPPHVDHIRKLVGKLVDVSVELRVFKSGQQKMMLQNFAPSAV